MRVFDCDVLANNKDWLVEQYVIKNLSMREIALICNISPDSIRTRLSRFDIGNGITLCEKHHIQLHKYTSSFIQECIKQTPNIGGTPEVDNPEAQIRKYLFFLIGSNDYQGESRTDYGIVWTATITNEIAEMGGNDSSHESE